MGTMSVPSRTLFPTLKVENEVIWFLTEGQTGAKRVSMAMTLWVSFGFFCDVHFRCQV